MDIARLLDYLLQPIVASVAFPLLAGLVCLLLPRSADRTRSALASISAGLTVAIVWSLFSGEGGASFNDGESSWLRVDALSAFVTLAISILGLLVAVYSTGYMKGRRRHREYFAYLLWTLGAGLGTVLANDLVLLLVCWGFLGMTLYLMIGIAGPPAAEAARKSFMIVAGTDALLVFGVVVLWNLSGTTRMDVGTVALDGVAAHLAFLAFAAAAFGKAGAVPFHAWVPDCGEKADAPVSAFLPASLDKLLGIYLLARSVLDLFELSAATHSMLMLMGAVTVIAAVLMALVQHDLKRLLAYHAVSQVGYMVLGIGTGTAVGVAGGLFHMLNNAIYKCCLFLCAGAVESRTGTTDLDRLGGLHKSMPLTFAACAICALAISGIPPLNGFASKWMVYQGIISTAETGGPEWIVWLLAAMLGSALTLASFVKVLHATFLCKPAPAIAERPPREVGMSMALPMLMLALLCVVFGVFAYALPLEWLIFPAVPATVPGVWWAGLASVLLFCAMLVGAVVYVIAMGAGRLRRVDTYVGGERMDEAYVYGVERGPTRHVEITGVDFYRTIERLPALRRFYELARLNFFDLYEICAKSMRRAAGSLRAVHTGVLPTYVVWFLAGALAVLYVMAGAGG